MKRQTNGGSGHAGALKELDTIARDLSDAPGAIKDYLADVDDATADLLAEAASITAAADVEAKQIAEDGEAAVQEYLDEVRPAIDSWTFKAKELAGKLKKAGVILAEPTENRQPSGGFNLG